MCYHSDMRTITYCVTIVVVFVVYVDIVCLCTRGGVLVATLCVYAVIVLIVYFNISINRFLLTTSRMLRLPSAVCRDEILYNYTVLANSLYSDVIIYLLSHCHPRQPLPLNTTHNNNPCASGFAAREASY